MISSSSIRNEQISLNASILAILSAVLWGGNSVSIKIGLEGVPPIAMACIRFAIGALTVTCVAFFSKITIRVPVKNWKGLLGLGLIFFVQILLLNVGTNFTNASRSTILISTYPFFTALFANYFLKGDQLTAPKIIGLGLSFSGVLLIFAESIALNENSYIFGDSLVLFSAILLGLRQVVTKRIVSDLHPYQVLFWQAVFSLPMFAILSINLESGITWDYSIRVVSAIAYQGVVVAGLCFILIVFLLRKYRASNLGAFAFITPIFGVLISALLLNEKVTQLLFISLGQVAIGILVVNLGDQRFKIWTNKAKKIVTKILFNN